MNLNFLSNIGINSITQLMVCLTLGIKAAARYIPITTITTIEETEPLTLETASIWKQKVVCWSYLTIVRNFDKLTDEEKETGTWFRDVDGTHAFQNTGTCMTSGPIIILGVAVSVVGISVLGKLFYNKWKNSNNPTINTKQPTDESLDIIVKPEEQCITESDALLDKTANAQQSLPESEVKKINTNFVYSGYQENKQVNNASISMY